MERVISQNSSKSSLRSAVAITPVACCWHHTVFSHDQQKTSRHMPLPLLAGRARGRSLELAQHTAKPPTFWSLYGCSHVWNREVERAIVEGVGLIKKGTLTAAGLLSHFERVRHDIAVMRNNLHADRFGARRDCRNDESSSPERGSKEAIQFTPMMMGGDYGYALKRALALPYDGIHYVEEAAHCYCRSIIRTCDNPEALRFGLVKGEINGKVINLTQYVFAPPQTKSSQLRKMFGCLPHHFYRSPETEDKPLSAIWLHPETAVFPDCIAHINGLIEQAMKGDLSVIPRIHWWSVHLSATSRGSGGITEMVIKTLCRYHGYNLPPWREGVAPSVEVLLQPDEQAFCASYQTLFASVDKTPEPGAQS